MSSRRRARGGFLADYRVDDRYLLKPDRSSGRAGILRARNQESRDVLIKFWPRAKGADDSDLEDIWRSEIRQLQRLAAVPRADDLFVHMVSNGKDGEGFYLVLDPGQGSPLELFQSASKKPELLAQSRLPRFRRILWANARRLAEALDLLHSQGAIHRNLDPWAVITTLTDEPDFRITGFEWSMRIAAVDAKHAKRLHAKRIDDSYSFERDWRDLALLFALILDIPSAPLGDMRVVPSRVSEHTSAGEIRLLRAMLGLESIERLDGEFVCTRIAEILDSIRAEAAGREAKVCLAVRLGPDSKLSESIRGASDNEIEIADEQQQIRFIISDLGKQAQLVTIRERDDTPRHALLGRLLTYRLAPYRPPRSVEAGNWEFAYCERADSEAPSRASLIGDTLFDATSIEIIRNQDASLAFPRRRGKVQRWDDYLDRTVRTTLRKTDLDRMHQSFALLLVLEMAYAAADVFPVKILAQRFDQKSDLHVIWIGSRNDPDRAKLSDLLNLEAPAYRLIKMAVADDVREEGDWILSEPGTLGERSPNNTSWRLVGPDEIDHVECLKFEGTSPLQPSALFLAPPGIVGRISQFKRRLKALTALREHAELLRMLVDPRLRIEDSQDPLDETTDEFKRLDLSKQKALSEILSTVPLFLLQGPPGVGKTYLVGDLVRRRFEDEPITRILLSAQSNSAIDHLMKEVQEIFASRPDARPLMVRARPADDDDSAGELEIDVQGERLLKALAGSDLVRGASPHIAERIKALAEARSNVDRPLRSARKGIGRSRTSTELRTFEAMILRAANLVFATTNSGAIERLIEERALFDWTIIEEAGKATGGELLSPLLLSHRRLMIGDHKQLPPFDIEKMSTLLASTPNVKDAVSLAESLVSRYLKDATAVDEIFREVENEGDDFGRACTDTLSVLTLFETFVEKELERQKRGGKGRPIARRLAEQYRMHPAIARIVSTCFYEGELTTNPAKEQQFRSSTAPFSFPSSQSALNCPVVFIDMPYGRTEAPGGHSGDRPPPWWNPDEAAAVLRVLELIRASEGEERPSIAVLSPYKQQVKCLQKEINRSIDGSLSHLRQFAAAIETDQYCGTVDSFQGGEADLVIVSLVRNNAHATPAKALGFLRDNRRMNVLLSRAKWRLVVVGSLAFYRSIVQISSKLPDQDIGFLGKFLKTLDEAVARKEAIIVPWHQLKGGR